MWGSCSWRHDPRLRVGLFEGVEVHALGLAFGVDLWPPALIVPLGGGRLGFADR